jgi:fumarate reductase subunit C
MTELTRPGTYRRPMSTWWWLRKRSYFWFAVREVSSLFTAWFVVFLLLLLYAVGSGQAAYLDFLAWARTPWVVGANVAALVFLCVHTATWFLLTPHAMVVRVGGRRLPAPGVVAGLYAVLAVASLFVLWLVSGA